ncbi:MAG: septal ring lytic transglycosylase RlpA family protein [Deltaproteobacteria bacterium]|nr:septal ring lytic transglycosylase RlpA family protein [Deltaproteobacteria bacterium]
MKSKLTLSFFLLLSIFTVAAALSGCVPYIIGGGQGRGSFNRPPGYYPPRQISHNVEVGVASWYGPGFQGRKTASGQIYNMYDLTAASLTLPLDSYAYVTDLQNHRSVEVCVNDRGPYADGRIMDLSYAAAKALNMVGPGTALVRVQYLGAKPVPLSECRRYVGNSRLNVYRSVKYIPPTSGYTLQFAAYTVKAKALQKISIIKKLVPGVHLATKNVKGVFYYKVVFGKFKDLKAAYNFAKVIVKYGYDIYITSN